MDEQEEFEFRLRAEKEAKAAPQPAATAAKPVSRPLPANAGVANFAASIAGIPGDLLENVANLGIAGYGAAKGLVTGDGGASPEPLAPGSLGGTEFMRNQLRKIAGATGMEGFRPDNPNPADPVGTAQYNFTSRGGFIPGGALPAAGSMVAEKLGGPQWAGVGAMVPAAIGRVYNSVTEPSRVASQQRTDQNSAAFKEAGVQPTAGQVTQSNFVQGLESLLSKFPGGQGIFRKFAENQQEQIGSKLKTNTSAEDAGRAIESGIKGDGGFISRFKETQNSLYNKLDQFIPANERIDITRTKKALADLNASIPGAPNTSEFFKNSKIGSLSEAVRRDTETTQGIYSSLPAWERQKLDQLPAVQKEAQLAAMNDGRIPYEALKRLRTLVGEEITNTSLASDVPKSKWKALYSALSDDLGVAASQAGPQATSAWNRANNYTRAGVERIESLDRIIGKTPEETFRRFIPKNPDEATTQRQVFRSLTSDERSIVSDAVVNRLGRARSGTQNDVGSKFSSETFLTNWNNMSEGAKAQLFSDANMRRNLDAVAKIASNIREGSGVFSNPSGSASAGAAYGIGAGSIGSAVATGNVMPIVGAASLVTGANVTARMLTSPKFVEWLSQAPAVAPQSQAAYLSRLGVIFNQSKDEQLRADLNNYIGSLQGK